MVIGPKEMLEAGRRVQEVAQLIGVDPGKKGVEQNEEKEGQEVTCTQQRQAVFFEAPPGQP